MTGETPAIDPALLDINRMNEIGITSFINEQSDSDEATFRVRRAYDTAWQHVYETTFPTPLEDSVDRPANIIIDAFDRFWSKMEDPNLRTYAEFASLGNWSRGEPNEIAVLFKNDAQYYYESAFTRNLHDLCRSGEIKTEGITQSPEETAELLRNFMTTTVITWMLMQGGGMSVDEARLGIRNIVFGPGPSQYS